MEKKLLLSSQDNPVQPYIFEEFGNKVEGMARPSSPEGLAEGEEIAVAEEPLSEELQARIKQLEDEARERGREEGHSEGFARGMSEGKVEAAASLGRLGEIISSLENFRENKLTEMVPQIIDLSLEIAKKIVHKEIDLDRNLILSVAQDAISKVGEKEEYVIIKTNPLDYEVMIPHIDLLKEQSGLRNISIEPSAAISPGGCYIETPTGEIDARLEEQMKEVQDVVSTAANRKM